LDFATRTCQASASKLGLAPVAEALKWWGSKLRSSQEEKAK